MKRNIVDLMDLYVGKDAVRLAEEFPIPDISNASVEPDGRLRPLPRKLAHPYRWAAVAASVLLVLGIAGAMLLRLYLGSSAPDTLAPAEPAQTEWGYGAPSPAVTMPALPESSEDAQPDSRLDVNGETEPAPVLQISQVEYDDTSQPCYGNLFYDGNQYYTRRNGLVTPAEVEQLHIDFHAYGDWDLNIDYLIAEDGTLALRDRSENEYYFHVEPVYGSGDTLRITVRRLEHCHVENCDYTVFYNIRTGETLDPLANVPTLFDYGDPGVTLISPDLHWALVRVFGYVETDTSYMQTGVGFYLCDLQNGTMERVDNLLPTDESQNLDLGAMDVQNAFWGTDSTLYVWLYQSAHQDTVSSEDQIWLAAYVPGDWSLCYVRRVLNWETSIREDGRDYLGNFYDRVKDIGVLVTDAAAGTQWQLVEPAYDTCWSEVPNWMLFVSNQQVYLVDEAEHRYACLSDILLLPEGEEINAVELMTGDFLCVYTDSCCTLCAVPEETELEWQPLTEWEAE